MRETPSTAVPGPSVTPTIVCVLVNWNGWQDTIACLNSLHAQSYPALQVIVVDNGSTNDSCQRIREAHPWVTLIETGRNLGFPGGCNAGTRLAMERGADYVWLLNNDTTVPRTRHKNYAAPRWSTLRQERSELFSITWTLPRRYRPGEVERSIYGPAL